ncbi:importin-5 [Eurytemora carolleeae]|uniref:importin-5 n=1 Tax=Eurytemora carolleeae TaxID=1294199 RepID=UPI000C78DD54|nr:importin-5 [Eurytemora carolleeae]|eukprot:XP_023336717.1 importin-5-like [Eurytemora affinis]
MAGGDVQELLKALLSTDNDIRSKAEESYELVPTEQKVNILLGAISNTTEIAEDGRQLASVMLRRLFSSEFDEFYAKLPDEQKAQLKHQILLCVHNEPNKNCRRKCADLAAEVARNLTDDDGNNLWPEFLKFLFDCASSANPEIKEVALHMFASIPGVFGNQEKQYIDVIKQMLLASLNDPTFDVRFTAVKATGNYLMLHEKDSAVQKHFADLLGPMMQVTVQSVENQDDEACLKTLIDITETMPKFLRPQLEQIFQLCLKMVLNEELGESWRHLALEFIVTTSETAPAMVRKVVGGCIGAVVQACLQMMTDIDEEEDWSTNEAPEDEDNDSNAVVAESALDRLACGLGGKTVFPHIMQLTPTMLQSQDWKYRHAALMAISASGEGCHKQMEPFLSQVMDGVINYIQDPHPRVRYACCNAIGQMSTDFAPVFEKKFHARVLPGLLLLMDDNANPRVQAHAGAALVNFSEDCPKNILVPYLPQIMEKLESVLKAKFNELVEKGNKLVLEQIVTTIASVADTAEDNFVEHYDKFMPCLKYMIEKATSPELRMLRGKTIECVSLIGLAVGGDKFSADASEVMELLLSSQVKGEELAEDDPQMSYMISAWARICKILGARFAPYLPLVMGPVMKTASLKPEVAMLDNDELNGVEEETEDWQFVQLGEQQNFGIKTAGLEDKATACQMLVCYARELKEHFSDYTEQVVKLMVPMLKFYFHDGVRTAAAESLPFLLECAKIKGPAYLQEMWGFMLPELLKATEAEPENDVLAELLASLARCIELLGKDCLGVTGLEETVVLLDKTMTEHFRREEERAGKRAGGEEDYDEGVEEQLEDEDDEDVYILSKVGDVIHAMFVTHGEGFLPAFERLLPLFSRLLEPTRPWSDLQWGLCIFDDLIEYTGGTSQKYQEVFLARLLSCVSSTQPEVRQAAAYGCGVLGQCGGPGYAQIASQAVPLLVDIIQHGESRQPENINPTENAISAVTKILKFNGSACNLDSILPVWFSWLPVTEDTDEAPYVYGFLADLVQANNTHILGPNNSNLPRVVAIIAEAIACEVLRPEAEEKLRIINIVKEVSGNPTVFEACVSGLSEPQKKAIQEILTS